MIGEAKRLHKLGFGLHWLKPNSKEPLALKGWQTGPRKTWRELQDQHKHGYNLGVRLGKASRFEDGTYLAVIDCDVKSEDPKHEKEMLLKLKELVKLGSPQVSSGRGNGSRHVYVRVKVPRSGYRYSQSKEFVKTYMPGRPPTRNDKLHLKDHEMKAGLRWRPAWEISVMGEGQQVVVPPSIHPDTGNSYEWAVGIDDVKQLPRLKQSDAPAKADMLAGVSDDWSPVDVDLVSSELPDSTVEMILSGKGSSDDSAALFTVAIAMVKAKFTDNEITSVLTDRDTHLGKCAYRHANTTSRKRAANWVRRYTLAKVKENLSARQLFADVVDISDDEDARTITKIEAELVDDSWKEKIEREGGRPGGRPQSTLKNTTMILANAVSPKLFKRDLFAKRVFYGLDTPWGGKKGEAITDTDAVLIKHWCTSQFRFEPAVGLIFETIDVLAEWNAFHPVREMLASLPEWDGTPRIDGWLKRHFEGKGPAHYLNEVFYKFLSGMIARVMVPGTQFDWMLIMEGEQGVGKSTFARLLAGDKYFTDWLPDLSDKDAAQALQGIWLIEMGELASLKKNEIETVKAFVTRRVDKYRPSYGRSTIEAPRQCVFMGSTNATEYLRDDTGNRRFVPIQVGRCDFDAIKRDREQLLAEAYWAYCNELVATLELEGDALTYSRELQAARMVKDDSSVMAEQFRTWLLAKIKDEGSDPFDESRFKLLVLFEPLGPWHAWKADGRTTQLAAKALKSLGYNHRKIKGDTYWRHEGVGSRVSGLKAILPPRKITKGKAF